MLQSLGLQRVGQDWPTELNWTDDPIAIFWVDCIFLFCRYFSSLLFPDYRSPFNICCKAGLVVLNSLNFCLSVKLLIFPSILNEILARENNFVCRFFPFCTFNISCHYFWPAEFLAAGSPVKCMGFPLYVPYCFSLAAFNILSLCLIFVSLINMCLGLFLLGFFSCMRLCVSCLDWLLPFPFWENFQL